MCIETKNSKLLKFPPNIPEQILSFSKCVCRFKGPQELELDWSTCHKFLSLTTFDSCTFSIKATLLPKQVFHGLTQIWHQTLWFGNHDTTHDTLSCLVLHRGIFLRPTPWYVRLHYGISKYHYHKQLQNVPNNYTSLQNPNQSPAIQDLEVDQRHGSWNANGSKKIKRFNMIQLIWIHPKVLFHSKAFPEALAVELKVTTSGTRPHWQVISSVKRSFAILCHKYIYIYSFI